jgi:hypothetical protein
MKNLKDDLWYSYKLFQLTWKELRHQRKVHKRHGLTLFLFTLYELADMYSTVIEAVQEEIKEAKKRTTSDK